MRKSATVWGFLLVWAATLDARHFPKLNSFCLAFHVKIPPMFDKALHLQLVTSSTSSAVLRAACSSCFPLSSHLKGLVTRPITHLFKVDKRHFWLEMSAIQVHCQININLCPVYLYKVGVASYFSVSMLYYQKNASSSQEVNHLNSHSAYTLNWTTCLYYTVNLYYSLSSAFQWELFFFLFPMAFLKPRWICGAVRSHIWIFLLPHKI